MQPSGYDRPIQESVIGKLIALFIIPGPLTLMSPSPFTSVANRPTDLDRPLRFVGLGLCRMPACRSRSGGLINNNSTAEKDSLD
jgi:hypothetical protein